MIGQQSRQAWFAKTWEYSSWLRSSCLINASRESHLRFAGTVLTSCEERSHALLLSLSRRGSHPGESRKCHSSVPKKFPSICLNISTAACKYTRIQQVERLLLRTSGCRTIPRRNNGIRQRISCCVTTTWGLSESNKTGRRGRGEGNWRSRSSDFSLEVQPFGRAEHDSTPALHQVAVAMPFTHQTAHGERRNTCNVG